MVASNRALLKGDVVTPKETSKASLGLTYKDMHPALEDKEVMQTNVDEIDSHLTASPL